MTHPSELVVLNPFPFCGGKAKLTSVRRGNYRREGDNWQGLCNKCRARGPLVQEDCQLAADKWNAATAMMASAIALVGGLVTHIEHETCTHEDTHRGGAIWEICNGCGAKWADDRGGKPKFKWPSIVLAARKFLKEVS